VTSADDLQKAIALAQQALGNYSAFASSSQDPGTKTMFAGMAHDMEKHLKQLNDRLRAVE
jgi:rubrerythrin